MTKQEFLNSRISSEGQRARKKSVGNLTLKGWLLQEHYRLVAGAVQDRRVVPSRVLAEYPGLEEYIAEFFPKF